MRLHHEAAREFEEVLSWYAVRDPRAALRFAQQLRAGLVAISAAPRAWSLMADLSSEPPVRRFVLRSFPFTLPYVVQEEAVFVLAVAHTHRSPGYWMRRL